MQPVTAGRTPVSVGRKEDACCVSFESFAYLNLGYTEGEAWPGQIAVITPEGVTTLVQPGKEMKFALSLWVYYGSRPPPMGGISVEKMRYNCGRLLAAGTTRALTLSPVYPDSGTAHAIGYANESGIHSPARLSNIPPTWPRSFMPTKFQSKRNLIAKIG